MELSAIEPRSTSQPSGSGNQVPPQRDALRISRPDPGESDSDGELFANSGSEGTHRVAAGDSSGTEDEPAAHHSAKKARRSAPRVRACVFTAHIDWRSETAMANALHALRAACSYFIVGKEICPTTGRPHLQGYAEFSKAVTIPGALTKDGLNHPHCEPRKGSQAQAIAYAKKDGNWVEDGVLKKQGARNDIAEIRDAVTSGVHTSARDVWMAANSYQSFRFGVAGLSLMTTCRSTFWGIEWHWGKTGSGKSASAFSRYPGAYVWDTDKWFEGYAGERVVIIDDFRRERCPFERLLRIADRYPLRVECKGGSAALLASVIVITAPVPPGSVFGGFTEGAGAVAQLWRRTVAICEHIDDGEGGFTEQWHVNRGGIAAGGLRRMDEGVLDEFAADEFEPIDPVIGYPRPAAPAAAST